MSTAIEWATWWRAAAFAVVPVRFGAKVPVAAGWPDLRLAIADIPGFFSGPVNVGIILGEPSGNAVDIDLDCAEACDLARRILPTTDLVFGRAGRPQSHRIYRTPEAIHGTAFKLDGKCLLEIRSTGHMTVVPASMHPTGEFYDLDSSGPPAQIQTAELSLAARMLAVATVVRRLGIDPADARKLMLAAAKILRGTDASGDLTDAYAERACAALGCGAMETGAESLEPYGVLTRYLGARAVTVTSWLAPDRHASGAGAATGREADPAEMSEPLLAALHAAGRELQRTQNGYAAQCPAHDDANASLSIGKGVDGCWILKCHAGCTTADVLAALELKWPDLHGEPAPRLPEIRLGRSSIPRLADEAWAALAAANEPPILFVRDGRLVALRDGAVLPVTADELRHRLARVADWRAPGKRRPYPPHDLVADMLSHPAPPMPILRRVLRTPGVLNSGEVLVQSGYHMTSGSLLLHDLAMPPVSSTPSSDDVRTAAAWLQYPLRDFPFVTEADRANALALMLLPFCRDLIQGPVPLHGVLKPAAGTGGTLLAKTVLYPALGREAEVTQLDASESEVRKMLTAKLRTDPVAILFDNVRGHVASTALASAVTSTAWEDRELSVSKMLSAEVRAVVVLTGNNLEFSRENLRRLVPIRLDAGVEDPHERRQFSIPLLLAHMAESRATYVWACLTLVRAWVEAGRPAPTEPMVVMGMFEAYCNVIGGILAKAGIVGFLANRHDVGSEVDLAERVERAVVEAWSGAFGDQTEGTVAAFYPVAQSVEGLDLGLGSDQSKKVRLGQLLRRMRGKRYGEFRFEELGKLANAVQYRLRRVASPAAPVSATDSAAQPA